MHVVRALIGVDRLQVRGVAHHVVLARNTVAAVHVAGLASRAVGEHLRSMGEITGGPRPFAPADRSKFLQALDAAVVRAKRR